MSYSNDLSTVEVETSRTKAHDFKLNVEEQVQRKVMHSLKAVLKVETNDEDIKIRPNSGNFKVLSEEIKKLKVGDEIKYKEGSAVVKDQYEQTDINKVPYMLKTEFLVTDVVNNSQQKAVLHTYLSQTFFMIQGQGVMENKRFCKDFFYDEVMKHFMSEIMNKRGSEIRFINKVLKAQPRPVNPSQWKRKQMVKDDKCDICSRTFMNKQGVATHKKIVHGSLSLRKKTTQSAHSKKINNELVRSDSVKSSRPNSPSPKKLHIERKVNIKPLDVVKSEEGMEESGKASKREGDNKVDSSTQVEDSELNVPSLNQKVREGLMTQLEIKLRLALQEIDDLKNEKKQLKAHNSRKHAGYEADYDEILNEKQKMSVAMVKLQSEKDILLAKVAALKNVKEAEHEADECIRDMRCEGDCEHVRCTAAQAQQLKDMKNQGGRRSSPVEQTSPSPWVRCPQCNYKTRQNNDLKNHVRAQHDQKPSCLFCLIGFTNQDVLLRHIEQNHSENTSVVRENIHIRNDEKKRGPCIFFLQPRGCKKGSQCDFSHDRDSINSIVKVPKMCRNGPGCSWKPRCRYIHTEDGETIPPRATWEEARVPREGARTSREEARVPRQEARVPREEVRRTEANMQGFVTTACSQPPPGYTMSNFPGLGQPKSPEWLRRWEKK